VSISCGAVEEFVLAWVLDCHAKDTALHVAHVGDGALAQVESALADALRERDAVETADGLSPLRRASALTSCDAAVERAEAALAVQELGAGWRQVPHARVLERLAQGDAGVAHSLISEFSYVTVHGGTRWSAIEDRVEITRKTAVPPALRTNAKEVAAA